MIDADDRLMDTIETVPGTETRSRSSGNALIVLDAGDKRAASATLEAACAYLRSRGSAVTVAIAGNAGAAIRLLDGDDVITSDIASVADKSWDRAIVYLGAGADVLPLSRYGQIGQVLVVTLPGYFRADRSGAQLRRVIRGARLGPPLTVVAADNRSRAALRRVAPRSERIVDTAHWRELTTAQGRGRLDLIWGVAPVTAIVQRGPGQLPATTTAAPLPMVKEAAPALPAVSRRHAAPTVLMLADLSRSDPGIWLLAADIRELAARGVRPTLLNTTEKKAPSIAAISPIVRPAIYRNQAVCVEAGDALFEAGVAIVYSDSAAIFDRASSAVMPRLTAGRLIRVIGPAEAAAIDGQALSDEVERLQWLVGIPCIVAATDAATRRRLMAMAPELSVLETPWITSLPKRAAPAPRRPRAGDGGPPVVGWLTRMGDEVPVPARLRRGGMDGVAVKVLDQAANRAHGPNSGVSGAIEWYREAGVNLRAFVKGVDFLVFDDERSAQDQPALDFAMAEGVICLAARALRDQLGDGPIYVEPELALTRALELWESSQMATVAERMARAAQRGRDAAPPSIHAFADDTDPALRQTPRQDPRRRVLFFSDDRVGLGHGMRLLAVARRLPPGVAPRFLTMGRAGRWLADAGYPVAYLPGPDSAPTTQESWHGWLDVEIGRIVDDDAIDGIVFDGNRLPTGLWRAIARRGDIPLIWLRRPGWTPAQIKAAEAAPRAAWVSRIIVAREAAEPGVPRLPAMPWRWSAVDPIMLFDPEELLPRARAAAALGLDPGRVSLLVNLGGGLPQDQGPVLRRVVRLAASRPDLQVLVATYPGDPITRWGLPHVRVASLFPLSRALPAFDFAISAAGYNSFHELIGAGVPTLFMSNGHAAMDDQEARVDYAQAQGACFKLDYGNLTEFDTILGALLEEQSRVYLRLNGARLGFGNGAAAAAAIVAETVEDFA